MSRAPGLFVVGVVVAGGEGVGADEDAPFGFVAEGFAAAFAVHFLQVFCLRAAVAVAHAVVAREVRGGFGRGDDVVGGNRRFAVGKLNVHQRRAQFFVNGGGGVDGVGHRRVEVAEVVARQADADAVERLVQFAVEGGAGLCAAG